MGFERRGERVYYYRARRIDGRVVKEYVGAGADAEQAAHNDEQVRAQRLLRQQRIARVEASLAQLTQQFDLFWTASVQQEKVFLLANNFYRRRGEWRPRGKKD